MYLGKALKNGARLDTRQGKVIIESRQIGELANYENTREWAIVTLDQSTGLNLAMFSSGGGDGAYYSYWGFAGDDEIVCLTTDFEVLVRRSNANEEHASHTITRWAR